MGFVDVTGPLVGLTKDTFQLSYFMAQLLPVAGLLMFGLLSVPMGILQDRFGKKPLLMFGLLVALLGLLVADVGRHVRAEAGNRIRRRDEILRPARRYPFARHRRNRVAGSRQSAHPRRFAGRSLFAQSLPGQAIKAIGTSMGFLLPPLAVAASGSLHLDWPLLFPVYSVIVAVAIFMNMPLKIHEARDPSAKPATLGTCFSLLFGNPFILMMVLGIFLYVGAENCFNSGVPLLLKENFHLEIGKFLWLSWCLFFLPILAGRFAGRPYCAR